MIWLGHDGLQFFLENQKKKEFNIIENEAKLKPYGFKPVPKEKLAENVSNAIEMAKAMLNSMILGFEANSHETTILQMLGKMFVDGYCLQNEFHFQPRLIGCNSNPDNSGLPTPTDFQGQ